MRPHQLLLILLFFHPPAPPLIYTLSLHDALPISCEFCTYMPSRSSSPPVSRSSSPPSSISPSMSSSVSDRKSTRLNSSHRCISYAVFCLKKKTAGLPLRGLLVSLEQRHRTHRKPT